MSLNPYIAQLNLTPPAPVSFAPAIGQMSDRLGDVIGAMMQRRHQEEQLQMEQARLDAQQAQWRAENEIRGLQLADERAKTYETQKEKMYPRWEKAISSALSGDAAAAQREFPEDGSGFKVEYEMAPPPPKFEPEPVPPTPPTLGPMPTPEAEAQNQEALAAIPDLAQASADRDAVLARNQSKKERWDAINNDPERRYPRLMTLKGRQGETLGTMDIAETRMNYFNMVKALKERLGPVIENQARAMGESSSVGGKTVTADTRASKNYRAAATAALENLGKDPALAARYKSPDDLYKKFEDDKDKLFAELMKGSNAELAAATSRFSVINRPEVDKTPSIADDIASDVDKAWSNLKGPEVIDATKKADELVSHLRYLASGQPGSDEMYSTIRGLFARLAQGPGVLSKDDMRNFQAFGMSWFQQMATQFGVGATGSPPRAQIDKSLKMIGQLDRYHKNSLRDLRGGLSASARSTAEAYAPLRGVNANVLYNAAMSRVNTLIGNFSSPSPQRPSSPPKEKPAGAAAPGSQSNAQRAAELKARRAGG